MPAAFPADRAARPDRAPESRRRRRRALLLGAMSLALVAAGTSVALTHDDGLPFLGTPDDPRVAAPALRETPSPAVATEAPTATTPGTIPGTTPGTTPRTPSPAEQRRAQREREAARAAERDREAARRGRVSLVELAEQLAGETATPTTTVFRTATLNVLGDSHTARGGNKPGMASGVSRMSTTVGILRSRDISIVALQEFERVQKGAFLNMTGGGWSFYAGDDRARDAVAWRTDTWELVQNGTRAMPYFGGNLIPMPWVLLRHRETGQQVYAISMHNPTSNRRRGNNQVHRDRATAIQVALSTELAATGFPVLLMGDFNEKTDAFCKVTASGLLSSASGGGTGAPCSLPATRIGIDWIFGTPDVAFTDYARDHAADVRRATDHPLIVATATVTATPPPPVSLY